MYNIFIDRLKVDLYLWDNREHQKQRLYFDVYRYTMVRVPPSIRHNVIACIYIPITIIKHETLPLYVILL